MQFSQTIDQDSAIQMKFLGFCLLCLQKFRLVIDFKKVIDCIEGWVINRRMPFAGTLSGQAFIVR